MEKMKRNRILLSIVSIFTVILIIISSANASNLNLKSSYYDKTISPTITGIHDGIHDFGTIGQMRNVANIIDGAYLIAALAGENPKEIIGPIREDLDELAQQAAIEALRKSNVVIFCVDISKTEWSNDAAIRKLIEPKTLLTVATKCDLIREPILSERLAALNELFDAHFMPLSAPTNMGIESLRETIDSQLTEQSKTPRTSGATLTARHRQAVTETANHINESIDAWKAGNDEIAAFLLRAACQSLSDIRQPIAAHIDEQILEQIFNRFCIGK